MRLPVPYLDGPELENFREPNNNKLIKFYWLIPTTESELIYKQNFGVEKLEEKFDENFNYLDALRSSVV